MAHNKPFYGTFEEWEKWEASTRQNHPIWFFFHESLPRFWGGLLACLRDMKWWLLHRIHPRHRYHVASTGLEPGYYDPDTVILHAMFRQLERFYKHWCWAGDPVAYAMAHCEHFEDGDEDLKQQVYAERFEFANTVEELHQYWRTRRDPCDTKTYEEQQQLNDFDDKMLHRLIDIRQGLWI